MVACEGILVRLQKYEKKKVFFTGLISQYELESIEDASQNISSGWKNASFEYTIDMTDAELRDWRL